MNAPKHPSFSSTERSLFLVLDGGGARGVAHVAVWRALERLVARPKESWRAETTAKYGPERYRLAGIAGTSAGAIAAAFIVAGAEAGDLIDQKGQIPICSTLGLEHFHDIFGIRGWRRLRFFRFFLGSSAKNLARVERLTEEITTSKYPDLPPIPPPARKMPRFPLATSNGAKTEDGAEPASDAAEEKQAFKITIRRVFIFFTVIAIALAFYVFPVLANILFFPDVPLPVYLLVLWLTLHAAFIGVGEITRRIERKRTSRNERSYGDFLKTAVHPCASTAYAIMLASTACFLAHLLHRWSGWSGLKLDVVTMHLPDLWRFSPIRAPQPVLRSEIALAATWLACFGLYYFSFRRTLRGFFKGSIAPERIQEDIERVLRHLLLYRCAGWNKELKRYEWTERQSTNSLKRELASRKTGQPITFQELFDATEVQLTVVAADTIRNEVHTYSVVTHPNESVARAVSASMAIPFLFRPVRDKLKLLVDGAIVSSIPAWVFRRHRNRDPDCLILAARIETGAFDYWIPLLRDYRDWYAKLKWLGKARFWWRHVKLSWLWPWNLFLNIISTGAFGARALELDATDRLVSFSLWPTIGLLDFDVTPKYLAEQLAGLESAAELEIVNLLWERKGAFEAICQKIEDAIRGKLDEHSRSKDDGHIRMFWATRDGYADSVRMKLTYKFLPDVHVDDRLVMPYGTSMSAFAMQTRGSQFANVEVLSQLQADRMNRYRAAVKWKELKWCWAIPVGDPSKPSQDPNKKEIIGILAIESDKPLSYFDRIVGDAGNRRSKLWLKADSENVLEGTDALLTAAKANNDVRHRMQIWERQFEGLLQRHFVEPLA